MYLLGVTIQPIMDGHLIQAGFIHGHQALFVERISINIKTMWRKAEPNDAAMGKKEGKREETARERPISVAQGNTWIQ